MERQDVSENEPSSSRAPLDRTAQLEARNRQLAAQCDELGQQVSKLQSMEQDLRENQAKYQALVDKSADGVVIVQDDRFVFCNQTMTEMTGYTLDDLAALPNFAHLLTPEYRDLVLARHRQRMAGDNPPSVYEGKIRCKDGRVIDVELCGRRILLHGRPANIGTIRDITGRKRAEAQIHQFSTELEGRVMARTAQLHESEARFRRLVEQAADIILVHDGRGRLTNVNRRACEMLGYTRPELLALGVADIEALFNPAYADKTWSTLEPGQVHSREGLCRRKDGTTFPTEIRLSLLEGGEPRMLMAMIRDVSLRKKAQDALRASERQYRQLNAQLERRVLERTGELKESERNFRELAENAHDAIVITTNNGKYLYVNARTAEMTGYAAEDLVGMHMRQLSPPDQRRRVMQYFRRRSAGGAAPRVYQTQMLRKDGQIIPVEISATRSIWQGRAVGMAIIRDIIDRQQAEEALRRSEERYRDLFDSSPVSLWEEDRSEVKKRIDGLGRRGCKDLRRYFDRHPAFVAQCAGLIRVLDVNKASVKLYGARRKADLLQGVDHIMGDPARKAFKAQLLALASGKTSFQAEDTNTTLDGKEIQVALRVTIPEGFEHDWSRVVVSVMDITAQCAAQAALKIGEARYRSLFQDSPLALWVHDFSAFKARTLALRDRGVRNFRQHLQRHRAEARRAMNSMKLLENNRATGTLLEVGERRGRQRQWSLSPHILDTLAVFMENIAAGRHSFGFEAAIDTFKGGRRNVIIHAAVSPEHIEKMDYVLVTVVDITERQRAEQELREGERRFRTLVSNIPGAVYRCQFDAAWSMHYISDAIETISGYRAQEFLEPHSRPYADIILPQDRAVVAQNVQAAIADRRPYILEYRILHRDGGIRWVWEKGQGVFDGQDKLLWLDGVILDDTQRKLAEDATRGAHRQLIHARESERRRLAAELHDSVGQDLIVMQLAMKTAGAEGREHLRKANVKDFDSFTQAAASYEQALQQCSSLIRDVRNISHGLYPPTLQSLGLVSALRRLAGGMSPRLPIRVAASKGMETARFSPDVEIALFRIAQESVSNAARHSRAKHAEIRLEYRRGLLTLCVWDDGAGFDPATANTGLGLNSMRDRAEAVGGNLTIESARGSTSVTACVRAARRAKGLSG